MMGNLRDALRGWQARKIFGREMPEWPQLAQTADRLKRDLGEIKPRQPDPYSLDGTYRALKSAIHSPEAVAHLAAKHIRRAPWVLFQPQEGDAQPLAVHRDMLSAYLKRVQETATGGMIATLAYCFLYFYPVNYPFFDPVREAIRNLLQQARSPKARRLQHCDGHVGLFHPSGPQILAEQVLESGRTPEMVLADSCLAGGLEAHGFARKGYGLALSTVHKQLSNQSGQTRALEQLLAWSRDESGEKGVLRFPALRIDLAEALLLPFNEADPGPEVQKSIKTFLLVHYGDPRINGALWQGVAKNALGVMYRWLVQATLEDFFRFLDHVASFDKEADRHWTYRRAFWTAYFQAGMIEEAWVAFGPDARREAKRRLKDMDQDYAELRSGSNVKSNHAVLLLRIGGGLVVTEWSHMGKYRVWHPDNEQAPRFYRTQYRRNQLVWNPDFEGSHQGSESGNWQRKLASYIRQQTGFSIPPKELMPR